MTIQEPRPMLQNRNHSVSLIAALVCVLVISGCGRRGALEPPPSAQVISTNEQGQTVKKQAPKPDKPFILDGLL